MRRRHLLATLAGLAAAGAGAAGCSGGRRLRVAVIWSGYELRAFQRLLATYRNPVSVYSAGDNIAALLRNPAAAAVPDVAIVSRPGLIQEPDICGKLQTYDRKGGVGSPFWDGLASCGRDRVPTLRGVWIKTAHKSLVWHRPGTMAEPGGWEQWHTELETATKQACGSRCPVAPLSIGAADGWVLTDWFENALLGTVAGRAAYPRLVAGDDPALWREAVEEALTRLGRLWAIPGLLPGGGRRALTTQFEDSVLDVFRFGTAHAVAAPDFAWQVVRRFARTTADSYRDRLDLLRFRFPGVDRGQPIVVGGDVAVALASGGEDALDFLRWLDDPKEKAKAPRLDWTQEIGSTPLIGAADDHPPTVRRAQGVQDAQPMVFDLSDQLTGGLAGGDGQGLWRILTEFFTAVTVDGERPENAVAQAVKSMAATAAGDRS
ncbi:hypothetical protein AB0K60_11005 [Thermopolyspora sp. NPDC052614]|uniref:hypothetical protein n=1 Tax=Thermopolyspora sp. NPDC052614 TaxID=3155682 RepID=UPI00342E0AFB